MEQAGIESQFENNVKKKERINPSINNRWKGFLLRHESEILAKMERQDNGQGRFSLYVINWALILIRDGRDQGYFEHPNDAKGLLDPITSFKKSCSIVLKYQITAIPLSLIQVTN